MKKPELLCDSCEWKREMKFSIFKKPKIGERCPECNAVVFDKKDNASFIAV